MTQLAQYVFGPAGQQPNEQGYLLQAGQGEGKGERGAAVAAPGLAVGVCCLPARLHTFLCLKVLPLEVAAHNRLLSLVNIWTVMVRGPR
jgi:hypothetical protein